MQKNILTQLSHLVILKQRRHEIELRSLENQKQDLILDLQKKTMQIDKICDNKREYREYVRINLFKTIISNFEVEAMHYKINKFESELLRLYDEQEIIKENINNIETEMINVNKRRQVCLIKEEKYNHLLKLVRNPRK